MTSLTTKPIRVRMLDVDAWRPTPTQVEALLDQLQPEEKARVLRFRLEIDKFRSLTGRLLLRWMAHTELHYPWTGLQFKRTEENKPYLSVPQREGFNLNVSHHGKWVAGACDTRALVGIDVMKYERPRGCKSIPDFFDTMRQYFTEYEWNDIENTEVVVVGGGGGGGESGEKEESEDSSTAAAATTTATLQDNLEMSQLRQFYKHWALKESYIKAVGIGLGFELSRAEFRYVHPTIEETNNDQAHTRIQDSTKATMYVDGQLQSEWSFDIYEPDNEHCVVVALGPFTEATPHFLEVLIPPLGSSTAASLPSLPPLSFQTLQVDVLKAEF